MIFHQKTYFGETMHTRCAGMVSEKLTVLLVPGIVFILSTVGFGRRLFQNGYFAMILPDGRPGRSLHIQA
jgi:hypothetical protein